MIYHLAADGVVVLHLIWIVFLILGALPGRRWLWVKYLHLSALAFSLALQIFHWVCPLTYLEVWLRRQGDPTSVYTGDFIGHYAERLVYARIAPTWILLGSLVVIGVSLWLYTRVPDAHKKNRG